MTPQRPFESTGERKLVTVLFADLIGSTSLGDRLDPERLHVVLDAFFRGMTEVIEEWGGTIEKYIGDAIVAVFGVPAIREDDPQRAIKAALEMLDHLVAMNVELRTRHGVELELRIGINTGEVIAPVGGPGAQMLVAGDAVNVAARLEQSADVGTILVGQRTYLATQDDIEFDPPISLDVRGKTEPVAAHRVRRVLEPMANRSRRRGGSEAPFVGRGRELKTLLRQYDDVLDGAHPRMARILGPAGIGKTRLVAEFADRVRHRAMPASIYRGRCVAAGHDVTYWALGELLRQACAISLDTPAEQARTLLEGFAAPTLQAISLAEDQVQDVIHALGATAGILYPGDPLGRLEPRAVADRIAHAWPTFATALAVRGPTVFIIEDLHWAGEPLLEMLDQFVKRSSGPLLILATARPEYGGSGSGSLSGCEGVSTIALARLTNAQSEALLDGVVEDATIPPGLRSEILAKADGNPFFLEELVHQLSDDATAIENTTGPGVVSSGEPAVLPDTVLALLGARIDALPPGPKRVLQRRRSSAKRSGKTLLTGSSAIIQAALRSKNSRPAVSSSLNRHRPSRVTGSTSSDTRSCATWRSGVSQKPSGPGPMPKSGAGCQTSLAIDPRAWPSLSPTTTAKHSSAMMPTWRGSGTLAARLFEWRPSRHSWQRVPSSAACSRSPTRSSSMPMP